MIRHLADNETLSWRDAWLAMGIVPNPLSAPLLVLNLWAQGCSLTDRALRLHAQEGEPYRISVRQLLRAPPQLGSIQEVFICENPTVLAVAAERLGARCKPLVCIEGQPKTSANLLLQQLRDANVPLRYHGDFDWAGIGIANLILEHHRATPWRMTTADYLVAAAQGSALRGRPTSARWDENLGEAMLQGRKAVHEEAVVADLLGDLALIP